MRILLSAFACEPYGGSERSNGWTWAQALAHQHEVVVLTDADFRPAVEAELARPEAAERLKVVYIGDGLQRYRGFARWRYYGRWQRLALSAAQLMHAEVPFDACHHVTFGTIRLPSYLWRLGIPFLWGPVGGGEGVSPRFYLPPWLSTSQTVREFARWLWNAVSRVDPRVRATARNAAVLAVTTPQTRDILPRSTRDRALVLPSSILNRRDVERVAESRAEPGPSTGLSVAFVGRLIGWKGPSLALHAFARYADDRPTAHLHLYGEGPMGAWLGSLTRRLGIADQVTFHGRIPRTQLLRSYARHQIFLFPSLHDSSGFASIEAMSAGLPVVCLDTGGPSMSVPAAAGCKVAPTTPRRAVVELAAALGSFTDDRVAWHRASDAARAHALDPRSTPTVEELIQRLYGTLPGFAGRAHQSRSFS
ncbi:MAG: glycosyltransferase [Egibacteraceae bacterium]